jgi:thiamine-phosphate pyrophosphorylase
MMWLVEPDPAHVPGERGQRSLLRIIDANRNRAAEALRVAEDVCRFHWNLEGLAGELKRLRHETLRAVDALPLPSRERLLARDVEGDVGRARPTAPAPAGDAALVGLRNIERAREALRAIEEASRSAFPGVETEFEGLRYRLYSIEKSLLSLEARGDRARAKRLDGARLCLLATGSLASRPIAEVVEEAIRAGVRMVQLREKEIHDGELLRRARALREVTARLGALFIVNDRPDIALLAHADGIHLGQKDLPCAAARSLVGEGLLIGVSTHSEAEIEAASSAGADYVGVGPVFRTTTKEAGPPLGPDGLRRLLSRTALPAFAIGGISPQNAREAARAGARKLAASSSILGAKDPAAAVREILAALG